MDKNGFTELMRQRGCVSDDRLFCGVYKGFPFMATFLRGGKDDVVIYLLTVAFSAPIKMMFNGLKKRLKGVAKVVSVYAPDKSCINLNVTTSKDRPFAESFDWVLSETIAAAGELGLAPPAECPICKQPGCDSYASVNSAYRPAHAACVREKNEKIADSLTRNESEGSYVTGAIGALLGGAVGALPTVLLVVFLNIISGWLCALIPLCAYYGYKLFRGKLTKGTLGVVIAVSVLMAPITLYFNILISIGDNIYGWFTPSDFFEFFSYYPKEMASDMLQILLFTAIGFAFVFRFVRQNNTTIGRQSSFSAASLRLMEQTSYREYGQAPGGAPSNGYLMLNGADINYTQPG